MSSYDPFENYTAGHNDCSSNEGFDFFSAFMGFDDYPSGAAKSVPLKHRDQNLAAQSLLLPGKSHKQCTRLENGLLKT